MIEKDFIIGKVSWLTQMASEPVLTEEQKSLYRLRYELLFKFLQENKLATKVLLEAGESVTDEHQLKVSDRSHTRSGRPCACDFNTADDFGIRNSFLYAQDSAWYLCHC